MLGRVTGGSTCRSGTSSHGERTGTRWSTVTKPIGCLRRQTTNFHDHYTTTWPALPLVGSVQAPTYPLLSTSRTTAVTVQRALRVRLLGNEWQRRTPAHEFSRCVHDPQLPFVQPRTCHMTYVRGTNPLGCGLGGEVKMYSQQDYRQPASCTASPAHLPHLPPLALTVTSAAGSNSQKQIPAPNLPPAQTEKPPPAPALKTL
jgi:hypothetical protein